MMARARGVRQLPGFDVLQYDVQAFWLVYRIDVLDYILVLQGLQQVYLLLNRLHLDGWRYSDESCNNARLMSAATSALDVPWRSICLMATVLPLMVSKHEYT